MKKIFVKTGNLYWVIVCALFAVTGCQKNIETPATNPTVATSQSNAANERRLKGNFQQLNIASDDDVFNPMRLDPNLINAWGLAFDPSGPALVNTNQGQLCLVYNVATGDYVIGPLYASATGLALLPGSNVHLGSNDFLLPSVYGGGQATGIFVDQNGQILGSNASTLGPIVMINNGCDPWLPNCNPISFIDAYTGVTIAEDGAPFIYAANFKEKRIDVFDGTWQPVNSKPFKDPSIPPDYAPFNIQNINNNLFVMYAKTLPGIGVGIEEQDGSHLGYIDIFKPDGTLLTRFSTGGVLNAPWGCAVAPASWTKMHWDGDSSANDNGTKHHFNNVQSVILIANHGDGYINAFNQDGQFLGRLRLGKKEAITIDGLRALSFAPATATTINPDWLFFTAGPDQGQHGLFGYLHGQ